MLPRLHCTETRQPPAADKLADYGGYVGKVLVILGEIGELSGVPGATYGWMHGRDDGEPMDEAATQLATLYRTHGPALLTYLRRAFGGVEPAEDLLQETLLQAARQPGRLAEAVSPRAWLFAIARNVALTAIRRRRTTDAADSRSCRPPGPTRTRGWSGCGPRSPACRRRNASCSSCGCATSCRTRRSPPCWRFPWEPCGHACTTPFGVCGTK